jgi:hypothetical protein
MLQGSYSAVCWHTCKHQLLPYHGLLPFTEYSTITRSGLGGMSCVNNGNNKVCCSSIACKMVHVNAHWPVS